MRITVLFIDPAFGFSSAHPQDLIPPMTALSSISVLQSHGHSARLLDSRFSDSHTCSSLLEKVWRSKPQVVVIYFCSPQIDTGLELIRIISRKVPVIACGQHPASDPLPVIDAGAYTAITDPDEDIVLPAIISRLARKAAGPVAASRSQPRAGNITYPAHQKQAVQGAASRPNEVYTEVHRSEGGEAGTQKCAAYGGPGAGNLDDLPFLPLNLCAHKGYKTNTFLPFSLKRQRWGFMLTSRGCPYSCTFCSRVIRESSGKTFRAQSPERVVEEMAYLAKHGRITAINFTDDIFSFDLNRASSILELALSKKVCRPWVAQTHAAHIDENFMRLARVSGCLGLIFGLESGSDRILKQSGKGLCTAQVNKAFKLARKHKVPVLLTVIFGHPGETRKDFRKTIKFVKQLRPDMVQAHLFTPYPGSRAADLHGASHKAHHYNRLETNLSRATDHELINAMKTLIRQHYLRPSIFLRTTIRRLPALIHSPLAEFHNVRYVMGLAGEN